MPTPQDDRAAREARAKALHEEIDRIKSAGPRRPDPRRPAISPTPPATKSPKTPPTERMPEE